jgi:hypothetical protein
VQGSVATTTEDVSDALEQQSRNTEKAGGELTGLTTRTQDFVGLLNKLDPSLGAVAASMSRATRIAGELGIGLAEVGVAVTAVYALHNAWVQTTEAIKAATDALKKQIEAYDELRQKRDEQQSDIERIAEGRREGGFSTPEESRAAQVTAEQIGQRFKGALEERAVNRVVALLGGQGLSVDQLAEAAFLEQTDRLNLEAKQSAHLRLSAFNRASRKGREFFDRFAGLEEAQAHSREQPPASTFDIKKFLAALPGEMVRGADPELISLVMRELRAAGEQAAEPSWTPGLGAMPPSAIPTGDPEAMRWLLGGRPGMEGLRTEDVNIAMQIMRMLDNVAQKLDRAADTMERQPSNVTISGNKFVGPDADSFMRRATNGETRARSLE